MSPRMALKETTLWMVEFRDWLIRSNQTTTRLNAYTNYISKAKINQNYTTLPPTWNLNLAFRGLWTMFFQKWAIFSVASIATCPKPKPRALQAPPIWFGAESVWWLRRSFPRARGSTSLPSFLNFASSNPRPPHSRANGRYNKFLRILETPTPNSHRPFWTWSETRLASSGGILAGSTGDRQNPLAGCSGEILGGIRSSYSGRQRDTRRHPLAGCPRDTRRDPFELL